MPVQAEKAEPSRRLKVLFITSWYPTKENPVAGVFVREHAKAVRLYDDVVVPHSAGRKSHIRGLWQMEQETDQDLTEAIPTYRLGHRRSPIPRTTFNGIGGTLPRVRASVLAHHGA